MVDNAYLGAPGDVAISGSDSATVDCWSPWVESVHEEGGRIFAQLLV